MNETRGLWRGKTTPKRNEEEFNSIWVEGDLIHSERLCYIHPFANAVKVQGELGRLIVMHKVDPLTLGRCTGRRDNKGNHIFEGDIVKTKYGRLCLVEWRETPQFIGFDLTPLEIKHEAPLKYDLFDCLEIIGNIHDSPELLKGGK